MWAPRSSSSEPRPGRRPRRRGFALGLAGLLSLAGWTPPETTPGRSAEPAAIRRALERELAAARQDGFYLVLDVGEKMLHLCRGGVDLRTYPLSLIELGRPSLAFVRWSVPEGWMTHWWVGGRLSPARAPRVPEPAEVGTDAAAIPPAPEELFPAPSRFTVRYPGGLALEIGAERANGPGIVFPSRGRAGEIGSTLRDVLSGALRLRVAMAERDEAELYRALPEDTALLIRATAWTGPPS